jgi:glycosyltransferase involved in cell wall biosynthesis
MRLLVLHSQLGTLRGGGENFSRNLFVSFAALGHQVKAAFAADPFGGYPFPLPPAVEAMPIRGWWSENAGQASLSAIGRRLPGWPGLRQKWDYAQNALAWRTFAWNGRRFQRRILADLTPVIGEVDAIYVHSNPYLASEVARLRPTVLRLPGPLTAEMQPILSRVQAVCANGDALKRIRTFLGDRALELPVGLDDQSFSPGPTDVRARFGWTAAHKVIGYVGRLSRIKGVDLLVDGFRGAAQRDREARMLIVGSGEEERTLRAALAAEIAGGTVCLAGDVAHEQLPHYYRAMDLMVMPSRYENYSNAMLEALACGVPFVASDVGGNRALFETGAGWLFAPGSGEGLAASLIEALAADHGRTIRGELGRRHVSGRYNWGATARRLEQIIGSLPPMPPTR